MAMRYGAVHTQIWQSRDFRSLTAEAKMLFLYLLTSPHANLAGIYLLPMAYAQDDLGWDGPTLERAMSVLIERQMANYDEESRVVWVVKYLKYNPIRNQKQAIGAANAVKTLPKIPLVCDFVRAAIAYSPDYASHFDSLSIAYGCPIDSIANKTPTPTDTPTPTPDAHAREVSSLSSDGQAPSGTEPPEPEVIPERVWEELTGRVVTSTQSQEIQHYLADGMEPEVIVWAIETAVAEGKRNWSYTRGIIRNLFSEDGGPCLTMAQVRTREAERQQRSRADPRAGPIDTEPPVITDAELKRLEWMDMQRRQEAERGAATVAS
jgi:DnaD/phage-associated family protein